MTGKKSRVPTQRAIAEEIGVSRETVSHILSGKEAHRYNEETREKVAEAAKRLGYRPNRAAQTMRKGRSGLIGIIHFGVSNYIARQTAHFLPQTINSHGYETLVMDLSWHGNCHRRALEHLIEARVEGVIISHMVESFGAEDVDVLSRVGIPAVTLAGSEKLGIPALFADSRSAFEQMVVHLHGLGHRKLLLLTNDYDSRTTHSRMSGFRSGLKQVAGHGVEGEIVQLPADQMLFDPSENAYRHTKKLIQNNALPDAILCTNDQWARGVFAAAFEAGLSVPDDLAITGFDDEPFTARAPYYLTTASPNVGEESEKAVEVLIDLIAGKPAPQQQYIFPCHLVIRKSCGAERLKLTETPPQQ